jgi:hypothetical protein
MSARHPQPRRLRQPRWHPVPGELAGRAFHCRALRAPESCPLVWGRPKLTKRRLLPSRVGDCGQGGLWAKRPADEQA